MRRDSIIGLGIESRWERDFPHPSIPALGPTRPPIKCVPGLFLGVKRQGRGVDHLIFIEYIQKLSTRNVNDKLYRT
jgi:hypothetical protein